jgi:hypothetical protein
MVINVTLETSSSLFKVKISSVAISFMTKFVNELYEHCRSIVPHAVSQVKCLHKSYICVLQSFPRGQTYIAAIIMSSAHAGEYRFL